MKTSAQLDLFSSVLHAYAETSDGVLDNATMYSRALAKSGLPVEILSEKAPVGKAQAPRSLVARKMRWYQQSLRAAGILEHVEGERGVWGLTQRAGKDLSQIQSGVAVVGFSTDLGIMILGSCDTVFSRIDSPISLVVTSPPYPLAQARAYGNVSESQYVDWIIRTIEPIVKNLVRGGSIALNISNDVFMPGSPARSLYRERLVLALHDKLGLYKVDELIWRNPSKAPGPIQWASLQRVQLNVEWEPVYWFTNDPSCLLSDNRRVRTEHTERHLKLIAQGGEQRARSNSDGAYRIRAGAYGTPTEGRIPRNVLTFGHACADQRAYKRMAREQGLPAHGAAMPLSLASFLIEFMSKPGDLVVDPFGGSGTTGRAAQRLGRRWMMTDVMAEYVLGAANRFRGDEGFQQLLTA